MTGMDIRTFPRLRLIAGDAGRVSIVALADLLRDLDGLTAADHGDLLVTAEAGPRPWWQRLLGAERYVQICFALRWNGAEADLHFYDIDNSEHRVIDAATPAGNFFGEDDLPIRKELALRALRDFIATGQRPDYVTYRFAK
jgi:hypothetical protein